VFDHVRRFRRSARVVRTGAGIYVSYKRTQRRVRKLDEADAAAAWEAQHTKVAETLYQLAVDLKGLYIKSAQFIGTRTDVVPAPFTKSLSRLQDSVPPRPAGEVRKTIEHELGKPIDTLFATFDDTALGAASLAQVHRATLHDGREVVVKVQYPEVADLVRLDIRNLRTLVGIVARREPNFDYRAIVNEIGNEVPLEVDFVREAEMTRRVRTNLEALPNITVPRVVEGFVSGKVLVTEYVHGARLLDRARLASMDIDRIRLAQTIAHAYGHQIMVDGLFQADPHPGNILVLEGGGAALLDFGLTKELPEHARLGFARLVIAAAARNPAEIVAAFSQLGVKTRTDEPESLLQLMQLFFDARPADEGGRGIARRGEVTRANPIEAIPGDLVLLGRVIGLLRGVCSSLGAPLSPMQMLRPYAEAALAGAAEAAI
jgi:predicted unusual protein kinase regulating ubiquinone biosynthesis (AarF/ABC1/UbiB family)